MAPKKERAEKENVSLGPSAREGENVFGVCHIFASFNDSEHRHAAAQSCDSAGPAVCCSSRLPTATALPVAVHKLLRNKSVTEAVDSKACLKAELPGGNCFTDMEFVFCCSVRARHGSVGQGDDVPHHWRHEGQGRPR